MTHDVFVSYSSIDRTITDAVCAALERAGIAVWMAPRDIGGGKPWGEAIIDAINASRIMVVVFSANSDKSRQVLHEVERATSKGLIVIPFRIDDTLPSRSMELFLSSYHWLDARTRPIEPHLATLTEAVQAALNEKTAVSLGSILTGFSGIQARTQRGFRIRALAVAFVLAAVVASAGVGIWRFVQAGTPMDPKHVAVLPFRNLENDAAVDHLSLEMPLALDAQLSRMTSLSVVPFGSAMKFRDMSTAEIAKALHVGTVVEGSFSHSGEELNVDVNIVDANRDRYLWSEPFQALLAEFRTLIDKMVPKVTEALRLSAPAQAIGTQNSQAYALYIRALTLDLELNSENNAAAIEALKQALTLDGDFAEAHAALAEAYVTHFWWNLSDDTAWLDRAEAEARASLRLASTLPEGHYALAYALEGKGRRADAAREYFASVRAGPHYVPALSSVARYEFYMADFDRALATLDTIAAIDPTNNVHVRKAMCFYFAGKARDSATENQLAEKNARGVDELTLVAFTYVWLKDFAAAERVLNRLEHEQPTAFSIAEIRAWLYTARGDTTQARAQMELVAKRQTFGVIDELATLYAIQGDKEQAIALLSKAVRLGAPNYAWYRSDFFKLLRGDPRYEAILATLADEYKAVRRDAGSP